MWPAKAFNLDREAQNFVYLARFFHKTYPLKTIINLTLEHAKKYFLTHYSSVSQSPGRVPVPGLKTFFKLKFYQL